PTIRPQPPPATRQAITVSKKYCSKALCAAFRSSSVIWGTPSSPQPIDCREGDSTQGDSRPLLRPLALAVPHTHLLQHSGGVGIRLGLIAVAGDLAVLERPVDVVADLVEEHPPEARVVGAIDGEQAIRPARRAAAADGEVVD